MTYGGLTAVQWLGLGGQAVGLGTQTWGTVQEAKAFNKYSQIQINNTLENHRYQLKALKNRYAEDVEATNQQRQAVYLQNLQNKATALTSAAGNGVAGSSIDSLFLGYDRATAVDNYLTDRELRLKGLQLEDDADALRANALSSIYSLQTPTNKTASTLLSGIGGMISQYSDSYLKSNYYKK